MFAACRCHEPGARHLVSISPDLFWNIDPFAHNRHLAKLMPRIFLGGKSRNCGLGQRIAFVTEAVWAIGMPRMHVERLWKRHVSL
jgi:hypothetical protein